MTADLPVDVERLLSAWLRDQPEIVAIFGDRVVTELPSEPVWPILRLQRIAGGPTSRLGWLDAALVQFDVWGGPKALTYAGIATTLAVLRRAPGTHEQGVVTAVEQGSLSWLPDDSFSPPRPRYTADVTVWTHPVDTGS